MLASLGATLLLTLAGCATNDSNTPQQRDIRTESDQSDAERRARTRMELASAYFSRGQNTTALDEVKLALVAKPDAFDAYNLRRGKFTSNARMICSNTASVSRNT